jgi:crossover junction endodeoxyribonuclease RusA
VSEVRDSMLGPQRFGVCIACAHESMLAAWDGLCFECQRRRVSFFVPTKPVTQGNHRVMPNGRIKETSKGHAEWRAGVCVLARHAMRGEAPLGGPIFVEMLFYLPKPKKPKHAQPITKPDLSKLVRAVEDSLSKIVIGDDSQIVCLNVRKVYALPSQEPGCRVIVSPDRGNHATSTKEQSPPA